MPTETFICIYENTIDSKLINKKLTKIYTNDKTNLPIEQTLPVSEL